MTDQLPPRGPRLAAALAAGLLVLVGACGKPAPTDTATPAPQEQTPAVPKGAGAGTHPEKPGAAAGLFPGPSLEGLPAADEAALTIVYTNNADGEIEPCG